MKKKSSKINVANTVLLGCIFAGVLAVIVYQIAWTILASREMSAATVPLVRTTGVQGEIRKQLLAEATTCGNDNRSIQGRIAEFNSYLVVNATGDRAIIRMCNDIDQLYARGADGVWRPVFTVNADTKQDNKVRTACKIEDITIGENDTRVENQGMNEAKIEQCQKL